MFPLAVMLTCMNGLLSVVNGDMEQIEIQTTCEAETEAWGYTLAAHMPRGGLIALYGDLGAGKTCFVRGMVKYLSPEAWVNSPTFTLINRYGEHPAFYHVDLYRIGSAQELFDVGWEDILMELESASREGSPPVFAAVEWAEKAEGLLPEERLEVHLRASLSPVRFLRLVNRGVPLAAPLSSLSCRAYSEEQR
jgi:tRNA threonylcarbamoyladenosine biosynthesis protein TsaE